MSEISRMTQTMEQLYLERDETGDVTFIVNSEHIRAHKCVLAALSPKYKAQFYGSHSDGDEIEVSNVSADAFKVFLQFFYKESVDLSMANIEMVLNLAKQSLVDSFLDDCINSLIETVSLENVCSKYRLAIVHDLESFREYCEQQITENTRAIFETNDFLHCSRDILLNILKMDSLACKETDVFNACILWGRTACVVNNLDESKMENVRAALGDAIYEIRFADMSNEEFAELHMKYAGLLTTDESIEVFYIIGKLKEFTPKKFNQTNRRSSFNDQSVRGLNPSTFECCRIIDMNSFECVNLTSGSFSKECSSKIISKKPFILCGFALGIYIGNRLEEFRETIRITDSSGSSLINPPMNVQMTNKETIFILKTPLICKKGFLGVRLCGIDFKLPPHELLRTNTVKGAITVDDFTFRFSGGNLTRIFFERPQE